MGTCIKIPYCMYPRMNIQIVFYRRILRFNFLGAVKTPYPHWNFRPTVRRPSDPVSDASGKTMILAPLPWATRSVCLNGSAPNFDGWFPSDCWPFSWRLTLPSTKWLMLWFLWLFVWMLWFGSPSLSLSQYSLFHWSFFVVGELAIMSPNW